MCALLSALGSAGCGGATNSGFGTGGTDGGTLGDAFVFQNGSGSGSGTMSLNQSDSGGAAGETGTTVVTVIYANTDDSLYELNPMTNAVTLIGAFSGLGSATATDCAVNAEGEVYVNTETAVYKATLPAGAGTVALSKVAAIAVQSGQKFYALGFAPPGFLGSGETLVGGDGNGELWSIDTSSGATRDLGSFGADPNDSSRVLALSGDVAFYLGSGGTPTGIATIRSCKPESGGGTGSCTSGDDYLAGIDMTALANAYTSGSPASSLLAGIYGGSAGSTGAGTKFGELFGLGVWEGTVYAFGRSSSAPPLVSISPSTGLGRLISASSGVTSGWSGAGVSTKTTVTIGTPPPIK